MSNPSEWSKDQVIDAYSRYVQHTYGRTPVVLVRGAGARGDGPAAHRGDRSAARRFAGRRRRGRGTHHPVRRDGERRRIVGRPDRGTGGYQRAGDPGTRPDRVHRDPAAPVARLRLHDRLLPRPEGTRRGHHRLRLHGLELAIETFQIAREAADDCPQSGDLVVVIVLGGDFARRLRARASHHRHAARCTWRRTDAGASRAWPPRGSMGRHRIYPRPRQPVRQRSRSRTLAARVGAHFARRSAAREARVHASNAVRSAVGSLSRKRTPVRRRGECAVRNLRARTGTRSCAIVQHVGGFVARKSGQHFARAAERL